MAKFQRTWWHIETDIIGTKHDDSLVGTDGDDFIDGRKGADTMTGGAGNDFYVVDNLGDVIVEFDGEGIDTVQSSVDLTLSAFVENLILKGSATKGTGNSLDNHLDGNAAANLLDGQAGSDALAGGGGNDTLLGGLGSDFLDGGSGNDTLDGDTGVDTLFGGTGNDTFLVDDINDVPIERKNAGIDTVVASVDWTLGNNIENLTLASGLASLKGYGNSLNNLILDNYGQNYIDAGLGNDTIIGGTHVTPYLSDTLIGGEGNDSIQGGGGRYSDLLYGGLGNDTLSAGGGSLFGEAGDDLLVGGLVDGHHAMGNGLDGGDGNDTLQGGGYMVGGEGNDSITGELGLAYYIAAGAGDDTATGSGGGGYSGLTVDMGDGNDYASFGTPATLTLRGGAGDDTLEGSTYTRDATIDGGEGNDSITASAGSAPYTTLTVTGGDGQDVITASGYQCTVDGGEGDDVIVATGRAGYGTQVLGGLGNDTLTARQGLRTVTGGDGEDTFVVVDKEQLWDQRLSISDFTSGVDQLAISQAALPVGNGDLLVDGAINIDGPGGFDASSELVIVTHDIAGSIDLNSAAAAIGSANNNYTVGQSAVFVVGNGAEAVLLYFQSTGQDADVSANELSILGHLANGVRPTVDDVIWTG